MKVYISGPITGKPNLNKKAFKDAALLISGMGHEVVNPNELEHTDLESWEGCMKTALIAMMECDAIYKLPGWLNSRGACVESDLCKTLKIRTFYMEEK